MDPDPAELGARFEGPEGSAGRPEVELLVSRPWREVESRFSRALSPGGSHVSSSPALPDGSQGRGA